MTKTTVNRKANTATVGNRVHEYLQKLPAVVPSGRVLVHNQVIPTRRLGSRGFRAWLMTPGKDLEVCDCGFAPELGDHFRVRRVPERQVIAPAAKKGGAR